MSQPLFCPVAKSQVIKGVDWVTLNHESPAVANMSMRSGKVLSLDTAVLNSINSGVTYVVAAGNDSNDACLYSPARLPEAITVAGTASTDFYFSYSNYGTCVDLFAPGVSIKSAWRDNDLATRTATGTSMAAPHVAGVAAMYLYSYPEALPAEVATAIIDNTTLDKVKGYIRESPNRLLYSVFKLPTPLTSGTLSQQPLGKANKRPSSNPLQEGSMLFNSANRIVLISYPCFAF